MKNLFTLITAILITASVFAQAPEKMSYQAVIRDASNALVTSQPVGMQLSILQGSISGAAVYVETQTPNTNINGLVSLEIGSGAVVSGTFNTIDWSSGPYFIKTETDPTGGTTYTITGTSQLLSTPYALHAKTADSIVEPTYTIGLWPELGGYVFWVSSDGKHGLVVETQDQGIVTTWYNAHNIISDPSNHSSIGQKYRDWRMPTKFELDEIYAQRVTIGGFNDAKYWSSTESIYGYAYIKIFGSGFWPPIDGEGISNRVRSVRTF